MLTKHIRGDFERMHLISSPSVRVRVARYLLHRHETTGVTQVDLLFNRSDLADYLGMYRTSLSREMKRFVDNGVVGLNRHRVNILNLDHLILIERDSYKR
jgi:CRP-like cAMP-binding protein